MTYLALVWPAADPAMAEAAKGLTARMASLEDWSLRHAAPGLHLWTCDRAPPVLAIPCAGGVVVGELYDHLGHPASVDLLAAQARRPTALARRLSRDFWGRYVALLAGPEGRVFAFADPSGSMPAVTWALPAGIRALSDDPCVLPAWARPPRLALDWDRIAAFIATPAEAAGAPLFTGVRRVAPGDILDLTHDHAQPQPVWRPADAASEGTIEPGEAAGELVRRVDIAVAALAGARGGLIVELSGGLDSAIVAASLGAVGLAPRVAAWVNRYGDRPEGDERAYARAVTDRLGVALTAVAKSSEPLTEADFRELAPSFWPAVNAVDTPRDRDTAARLAAASADGLMSGDGGDAVFFQAPSPLILSEGIRERGLGVLASPLPARVAARLRRPVWPVLRDAWRARRRPDVRAFVTPWVSEAAAAAARETRHPWLSDLDGLSPARALQVQLIAAAHAHLGPSRRGAHAEILSPLLAQPVVELCLRIPLTTLAGHAQDRAFARAAFADRLPAAIRQRRSKGDLTAWWQRWTVVNLPFLRDYLIDGCLAEAGVLDRGRLDAGLEVSALMWSCDGADLFNAAMVEAWVRHWQGRLPDASPRWRFLG